MTMIVNDLSFLRDSLFIISHSGSFVFSSFFYFLSLIVIDESCQKNFYSFLSLVDYL